MSADTNVRGLLQIRRRLQDDSPKPRPADATLTRRQRCNGATTVAAFLFLEQRHPISLKIQTKVQHFRPPVSRDWPAKLATCSFQFHPPEPGRTHRLTPFPARPKASLEQPAMVVACCWPKSSRVHGQTRRHDHGKVVAHWQQNASLADTGGPATYHVSPLVSRTTDSLRDYVLAQFM
jgi:hypothetical protein